MRKLIIEVINGKVLAVSGLRGCPVDAVEVQYAKEDEEHPSETELMEIGEFEGVQNDAVFSKDV